MALLHHGHTVGEAAHQVQVVRDQQHRHAMLALQVGQQVKDLTAQAHVERGGGLVGQQQLGRAGQRHGDHGALALASGMPVEASSSMVDASACRGVRPFLSCSTSPIWSPTV